MRNVNGYVYVYRYMWDPKQIKRNYACILTDGVGVGAEEVDGAVPRHDGEGRHARVAVVWGVLRREG